MEDKDGLKQQVLHLRDVEKLSQQQIADKLGIGRKRVRRMLKDQDCAKPITRKSILDKYVNLIVEWYKQYPRLKAIQVYERLKSYGYQGSYASVIRLTLEYRKVKADVYHALTFLPGQEAQVDWFFFKHERMGMVAGFAYLLSYSRYAWGIFYPRHCYEFFLAGHLECFKHIGGVGKSHLADALCYKMITRYGIPATRITGFDLVEKLKKTTNKYNMINYYATVKVLCLDELGYVHPNSDQAGDIFQIISKRSELLPTIITTNLIPSQWGKMFEASTATAILDRLSLQGSFIACEGKSYRTKKKSE